MLATTYELDLHVQSHEGFMKQLTLDASRCAQAEFCFPALAPTPPADTQVLRLSMISRSINEEASSRADHFKV